MQTCPRCQGNVTRVSFELKCVQCGHEPGNEIRYKPPISKNRVRAKLRKICEQCSTPFMLQVFVESMKHPSYTKGLAKLCQTCRNRKTRKGSKYKGWQRQHQLEYEYHKSQK